MSTLAERLLWEVNRSPGLTDRELTDILCDKNQHPSQVNQEARHLENLGFLQRRPRFDRLIGNYPNGTSEMGGPPKPEIIRTPEGLSEDEIKEHLECWLAEQGWKPRIAWGRLRGVDIEAEKRGNQWLIEVKGMGSRNPMRVNYFLAILGETLQRMNSAEAKYSIALPDIAQFRGLWSRLPTLAKKRTGITALFVTSAGQVSEDK